MFGGGVALLQPHPHATSDGGRRLLGEPDRGRTSSARLRTLGSELLDQQWHPRLVGPVLQRSPLQVADQMPRDVGEADVEFLAELIESGNRPSLVE